MKNPWVPICEGCWYVLFPDDYFPYHLFRVYGEECYRCKELTFANVHLREKEMKLAMLAQSVQALNEH